MVKRKDVKQQQPITLVLSKLYLWGRMLRLSPSITENKTSRANQGIFYLFIRVFFNLI